MPRRWNSEQGWRRLGDGGGLLYAHELPLACHHTLMIQSVDCAQLSAYGDGWWRGMATRYFGHPWI